MTLSKAVKPGMLVTIRGDKYIRASNANRIAGVYMMGYSVVMIDIEMGKRNYVTVPTGIQVHGPASILIGGTK